jgi:signal transduction histidine kinase
MTDAEELAARVAGAWIEERRRVERALHDGVQQDLVALAVGLQLAQERLAQGDAGAAAAIDELRRGVHDALERVRRLADELYPAGLETWGLRETLLRLTPDVRMDGVGRQRPELEAAIVFWCRAALRDARDATIELREDAAELRLEIAGGRVVDTARDLVLACGGTVTTDGAGRVVATFSRYPASAR